MVKQTQFQRFLKKKEACAAARKFVASYGGNFSRVWKTCDNRAWKNWLVEELVGGHQDDDVDKCPACALLTKSFNARGRFVLAQARKRGWVRA